MKKFFVIVILTISITLLIQSMDVLMGTKLNQVFIHLKGTFAVTEPAAISIKIILLAFLIVKPMIGFLVKKNKNKPTTQ